MKKHVSFLTALLLVVAMLFVSCGDRPGDPVDSGSGSGQSSGSGTGTGSGSGTGSGTGSGDELVIFDPANYTAPEGMEIVTGTDGNKYLKVTPKSDYSTNFGIGSVDVKGYTKAKFTAYAEETNPFWQFAVQGVDWASSGLENNQKTKFNKTVTASAESTEYTVDLDLSASTVISNIQTFTQNLGNAEGNPDTSWDALSDKTIYIGKIIAIK